MKLQGKVAIITGSARGIGKATALLFAKEGAKLVINSKSSRKEGEEVVAAIERGGGEAIYIEADISNEEEVKSLFEKTLNRFGKLDILVNNAGIHNPKNFLELTAKDWEKTFRVNVIGLFLCTKEAAQIMLKQRKGSIVNISSVRGLPHAGRPGNLDYSASKAAVINITKTMAKALAPDVRINAVAPGPADTRINNWKPEDMKYTYLGRLIKPEEIAKAVLFLASDESTVITGEVLVIDGGYSLKH